MMQQLPEDVQIYEISRYVHERALWAVMCELREMRNPMCWMYYGSVQVLGWEDVSHTKVRMGMHCIDQCDCGEGVQGWSIDNVTMYDHGP
jgi:hypothetical protein